MHAVRTRREKARPGRFKRSEYRAMTSEGYSSSQRANIMIGKEATDACARVGMCGRVMDCVMCRIHANHVSADHIHGYAMFDCKVSPEANS